MDNSLNITAAEHGKHPLLFHDPGFETTGKLP
jgi:hypothetical protein